jgi:hypothetical protein
MNLSPCAMTKWKAGGDGMKRSSSHRTLARALTVSLVAGLTATSVRAQTVVAPTRSSQSGIQSVLTQKRDSLQRPARLDPQKTKAAASNPN